MLQQAIQRYKGKTSQPSLASGNKSFTSISKQARQQNAVTLWLNVDETYGRLMKMLPADQVPQQIQMANGFVDFQNVDDFIASFSLRETGVALDANINFKDGNKSTFYNLIRTPNLNKDALKVIPAEAVALISLTLGGADSAQAQAARRQDQGSHGSGHRLPDLRQHRADHALCRSAQGCVAAQDSPIPPAAQAFGLALTSKNPQQTQQLLTTLLTTANLLPADAQGAPTLPETGRFDISLVNNMKLFGYTDQANKTMVLSLNAQVVETSITAMKQDTSVVSGGKLQDALATLPPATSKLVLVNVAGAIQLASQGVEFSVG